MIYFVGPKLSDSYNKNVLREMQIAELQSTDEIRIDLFLSPQTSIESLGQKCLLFPSLF